MNKKKKMIKNGFPEGFLGVYDQDNDFICVGCIKDDEDVDDEAKFTAILATDAWFKGEICDRCEKLIEARPS